MRFVSVLKSFASIVTLAAVLPASAGVVDFDGTAAPMLFSDTTALSSHYASLGLAFSGADGAGGSILNQAGEFGFMARSGTDFLAFNGDAGTGSQQRISFASAQDSVAIHAASYEEGTFSLTAFDGVGNVLGFASVASSRDWQALMLGHAGIRSILISSTTLVWGLDDLSFDGAAAVPEPGGLALLGLGLMGLVASRKRAAGTRDAVAPRLNA